MASRSRAIPDFDSAPFPQMRHWAEAARAPWGQGGPAMLETLNLEAPTRHGHCASCASIARHGRTARSHLPAWRRLDALQHRYPRPAHARICGARRLLRHRRRLRAVAREQVSGRRSNRSWTSCAGSPSRAVSSASTRTASRSAATPPAPISAFRLPAAARPESGPPLCGLVLNYGAFFPAVRRTPAVAMADPNTCSAARK